MRRFAQAWRTSAAALFDATRSINVGSEARRSSYLGSGSQTATTISCSTSTRSLVRGNSLAVRTLALRRIVGYALSKSRSLTPAAFSLRRALDLDDERQAVC